MRRLRVNWTFVERRRIAVGLTPRPAHRPRRCSVRADLRRRPVAAHPRAALPSIGPTPGRAVHALNGPVSRSTVTGGRSRRRDRGGRVGRFGQRHCEPAAGHPGPAGHGAGWSLDRLETALARLEVRLESRGVGFDRDVLHPSEPLNGLRPRHGLLDDAQRWALDQLRVADQGLADPVLVALYRIVVIGCEYSETTVDLTAECRATVERQWFDATEMTGASPRPWCGMTVE